MTDHRHTERRLLPEWHPQWGILLAWPDEHTDWAGRLSPARDTYLALIKALLDHEAVLLVCRDSEAAETARTLIDDSGADSGTDTAEAAGLPMSSSSKTTPKA